MEKTECERCKHYYVWEEQCVFPIGSEPTYKTFSIDYCSKTNKSIEKISKCNGFEEGGQE